MTEIVTLGLDGAAWHKLDKLIQEGHLPNLSELVNQGARAPLRTVSPPVTCPAWRCSTSGKNPGKLGVYWWLSLDRDAGEFYHPDSSSFDTTDIWDYLTDEGYKSGIVNIPMTYPPSDLNGTMVSGFGAPLIDQWTDGSSITCPDSFQEVLLKEYDWEVEVEHLTSKGGPDRAYRLIESRFELLLDMLEDDYDYIHLTIFYINMLQHKFGDSDVTTKGWKIIDEYLGELKKEDVLLIIYSDHGHRNIQKTFVINRWLQKHGYLKFEDQDSSQSWWSDSQILIGLAKYSASIGQRILPYQVIKSLTPIYRNLVSSNYPSSREVAERVNWSKSDAVATSQGPLYLNRERLGTDYNDKKEELRENLEEICYGGEQVLKDIKGAAEIYSGNHIESAPDLFLTPTEDWEIYGGLPPSVFIDEATSWTSGNHPTGILLLHGDQVEQGVLGEQSILDIMPTALSYMDCRLPTDIDGKVIQDPFNRSLPTKTREPLTNKTNISEVENEQVKETLEDLGYLK